MTGNLFDSGVRHAWEGVPRPWHFTFALKSRHKLIYSYCRFLNSTIDPPPSTTPDSRHASSNLWAPRRCIRYTLDDRSDLIRSPGNACVQRSIRWMYIYVFVCRQNKSVSKSYLDSSNPCCHGFDRGRTINHRNRFRAIPCQIRQMRLFTPLFKKWYTSPLDGLKHCSPLPPSVCSSTWDLLPSANV